MSTVIFLSGNSRGDALNRLGIAYTELFRAQGLDFLHLDERDPQHFYPALNRVLDEQPIAFAFSFMSYGTMLPATDENGKTGTLWQEIGVPFLSLMGDSPAYHFDLNVNLFPHHAILYGFPEHEALRRRLPKVLPGHIGSFLPLALDTQDAAALDFRAKAGAQLVFLKNGNDPQALWNSWDALRGRPRLAIRELARHLATDLADPVGNQLDDLVTTYFRDRGFDLEFMPKLRLFFVAQLDDYLRRLKSTMMGEVLREFPVQIVGENWEHVDFTGARATHTARCDYNESRTLIRDALGVIDMSPNVELAPHDRACRAFGAHTLCVTNEQRFFRDTLPHHDQFSFRFHPDALRDRVAAVLAHPARHVELGIEVAAAFRQACPPETAIRHLIDTASMMRLDQRPSTLPQSPDFFVWPPVVLAA